MTKKQRRRRMFLVKVGVYIAIVAGVVAQSAVQRFNPKELTVDLDFSGWSITRIVIALFLANGIYWKMEGSVGDIEGKVEKLGNIRRILTLGFTAGFTLMGIAGIGE